MNNPLRYQMTEYDCGPTSMLNAIGYLFEREEIPPFLLHYINMYCLDRINQKEAVCRRGTSEFAMHFICEWMDDLGKQGVLPVSSKHIRFEDVNMSEDGELMKCLKEGGVAVVKLFYEVRHYVLLCGIKDGKMLMFDPYYETEPFKEEGADIVLNSPCTHNRVVDPARFDNLHTELYSFGPIEERGAVLIRRIKDQAK